MTGFRPHQAFRPRRLVLPLEQALEFGSGDSVALRQFIRERLAAGDPGPLEIVDGAASTPAWDFAIVRTGLCVVLRKKAGLAVTEGRDE